MTSETIRKQAPESIPVAPLLPAGLDTPALVIDLDIVERNARRMAETVAARGIALRPHVKTHKSVALARLQIDAGAVGVTVGTLGEAEVMAEGGITDILLAYPMWADAPKAARLRALHEREDVRLTVGIDSAAGAERLATAISGSAKRLGVMIEIDPHYQRTGVDPAVAAQLGAAAAQLGLDVRGVFTHGGHAYRGRDMVESAANDEVEAIRIARDSLTAAGFSDLTLSAGSTPTALLDLVAPVNEVRPGTYLINDRIELYMGACAADEIAMAVAATVVSDNIAGKFVINAGAKSLTKDMPAYLTGFGMIPAYPDGVIERVSDYHGEVRLPADSDAPQLGDVVAVVPNHACPVIDLYDTFIATRSGTVIGEWPIDARGRRG
jgi:D-serine deaminase-like pyridoxal phosphate-dependent protein